MKALQPSKQEFGAPPPSKAKRTFDGKPRCFRCDQRGHIARYCTAILPKATHSEQRTTQLEQQEL
uniref:CCHC-type domain-containing protein n=1 Tax=Gouania willdenowi TaxID=441366 RepID=A0A8C5E809_GOUWI